MSAGRGPGLARIALRRAPARRRRHGRRSCRTAGRERPPRPPCRAAAHPAPRAGSRSRPRAGRASRSHRGTSRPPRVR